MHGWRDTEGCDGKRRRLVRLMWPAARVEAEAPPSPSTATTPSRFSVLSPRTTSYQLAAVAAQEQECVDSPRPVSPGSFIKVRLHWLLPLNLLTVMRFCRSDDDDDYDVKYDYTRFHCLVGNLKTSMRSVMKCVLSWLFQ
jgi:hypothetical protein